MVQIATAFTYLNWVVGEQRADRGTHDFYIRLLAQHKPAKLLAHLKRFGDKDRQHAAYDVDKALRLCMDKSEQLCLVSTIIIGRCSKTHSIYSNFFWVEVKIKP